MNPKIRITVVPLLLLTAGICALGIRLHTVRTEFAEAQGALLTETAALTTEKAEHNESLRMLTECAGSLLEREAICKKEAAAYREAANIMYRCEERQCENNWVPEERHHQCMSALWDVDEATADRLDMAELKAAREANEKDLQREDEGESFVTVALYDKCVGMLRGRHGTCDGWEEFEILLEELEGVPK